MLRVDTWEVAVEPEATELPAVVAVVVSRLTFYVLSEQKSIYENVW